MRRWFPRGLPIFWQTLLLLLASLVVSQAVSIALLLALPPPRPDFNRLGDIAEALDPALQADRDHGPRERALIVEMTGAAPQQDADMTSDPRFTTLLADRLGVAPVRLRLWFEPDQRGELMNGRRFRRGLVPVRRGEPLFFNTIVAAYDTGHGWRVVRTAPRPWLAAWQKRALLWFGVSALALLPFAWIFARALTRPIRRFADAADRMGADPSAPRVLDQGPAELRTAAHALNRMQERLSDYLAERTAMIGAIAHDLRTPLARIAFRIESAPDAVREKVQQDIEQMRAMIAATIGFVKNTARPTEFVPVALDALLDRLIAQEREIGRPVERGVLAPVTIRGDRMSLSRLFQNLVDNGINYGGAVTLSSSRQADRVEVSVADRGPGLSGDMLERVFHPFERGDPSRSRQTGGIGLGLTIARAIAQDHGGTLILRAREGGGLEAVASFPVDQR